MTIYCFLKGNQRETFKPHIISIEKAATKISTLVSNLASSDHSTRIELVNNFIENNFVPPHDDRFRNMNWTTALNLTLSISLSPKSYEKFIGFPTHKYLEKKKYLMTYIKVHNNMMKPHRFKKPLTLISTSDEKPNPEYFDSIYKRKCSCFCLF